MSCVVSGDQLCRQYHTIYFSAPVAILGHVFRKLLSIVRLSTKSLAGTISKYIRKQRRMCSSFLRNGMRYILDSIRYVFVVCNHIRMTSHRWQICARTACLPDMSKTTPNQNGNFLGRAVLDVMVSTSTGWTQASRRKVVVFRVSLRKGLVLFTTASIAGFTKGNWRPQAGRSCLKHCGITTYSRTSEMDPSSRRWPTTTSGSHWQRWVVGWLHRAWTRGVRPQFGWLHSEEQWSVKDIHTKWTAFNGVSAKRYRGGRIVVSTGSWNPHIAVFQWLCLYLVNCVIKFKSSWWSRILHSIGFILRWTVANSYWQPCHDKRGSAHVKLCHNDIPFFFDSCGDSIGVGKMSSTRWKLMASHGSGRKS